MTATLERWNLEHHAMSSPVAPLRSLWSLPEPLRVQPLKLAIGEVDNYNEARGFGFLDCEDGRLFFHASGFRVPRIKILDHTSPPVRELTLGYMCPPKKDRRPGERPARVPVPLLPKGTIVLYELGERNNLPQASVWCLRESMQTLEQDLERQYQEDHRNWQRAAIYRLQLHERTYGPWKADNESKAFKRSENVRTTTLFEGTNIDFLQKWFQSCRDSYRLGPDLWIALTYREWDEVRNGHGDWQEVPTETMHDFLG